MTQSGTTSLDLLETGRGSLPRWGSCGAEMADHEGWLIGYIITLLLILSTIDSSNIPHYLSICFLPSFISVAAEQNLSHSYIRILHNTMFRRNIAKMASVPNEYIGASGSCYRFKELLQERPSVGRVWLAKSDVLPPISFGRPADFVDPDMINLFWKTSQRIFSITFMRKYGPSYSSVHLSDCHATSYLANEYSCTNIWPATSST
jgi:hypothetical protein